MDRENPTQCGSRLCCYQIVEVGLEVGSCPLKSARYTRTSPTVMVQRYFSSFAAGTSSQKFPGNLGQLFNPKGLEFHQNLVNRYGGMVKVYGFFGVSNRATSSGIELIIMRCVISRTNSCTSPIPRLSKELSSKTKMHSRRRQSFLSRWHLSRTGT